MNSPPHFPMDTGEIGEVFAAETRSRCYTWPAPPPTSMFNAPISSHSSSPSSSLNNSMCSSINGQQQQTVQYGPPSFMNTHSKDFTPVMHSNFPSTSTAADVFSSQIPIGMNSTSMRHVKMPCGQVLPSINFLRTPSLSYTQSQQTQYGESITSSPTSVFLSQPSRISGEMESMSGDEDAESIEEQEGCDKLVEGENIKKKRIRRRNPDTMSQKKPNPWGEESYSDLIARALSSAPEGRLKLNEIYQWFSENVPYFRDRSSQEEAQGWKNSIRHNLSLHSRFMRIQNEGAGKSSWWVINPDAKPGRNPRRRAATMETTNKGVIDKKRRGARKRVEMQLGRSAGTSVISSQASILSQDLYNDSDEMIGGPSANFDSFRPRTQSTLSIPGNSSRVSPTLEPPGFEDFDFPPWMDAVAAGAPAENVTELLDRTDQMRLDGGLDSGGFAQPVAPTTTRPLMNGVKLEPQPMTPLQQQSGSIVPQRDISNVTIKQEIQPPPSYQELNAVRGNPSQLQNPLLRGQMTSTLSQQQKMPQGMNTYYTNRNGNVFVSQHQSTASPPPQQQYILAGAPPNLNMGSAAPQPWVTNQQTLQQMGPMNSQLGDYGPQVSSALPLDLENLAMPTDGQMIDLDMETVLRHELSQTRDNQLHFDLP